MWILVTRKCDLAIRHYKLPGNLDRTAFGLPPPDTFLRSVASEG